MALTQNQRAVGTFATRREAEQALNELRDSGFPMDRVSVVAKDSDRVDQMAGADMSDRVDNKGNKADDGAKTGAVSGGTVGGLTGLLVGLGALAIPGLGPVMLAGAGATALATALSGTAIGAVAGGFLGALVGLGIPEEEARAYSDRVSRGEYLIIVDGTEADVSRTAAILSKRGIQNWAVYNQTGEQTTRAAAVPTTPIASPPARVNPVASSVSTDDQSVRLYEERLLVDKTSQKTGEVVLGKHVETETASVSVPLEKERVVIERVSSSDIGKAVAPGEASFQDGNVVRMDVYEETADVQKETFVREEVSMRKEVDREVVNAEETIRREELEVKTEGTPIVDTNAPRQPKKPS